MKRLYVAWVGVLVMLLSVLLPAIDVLAATPFDDTVNVTDTLVLQDTTGNEQIVVNGNWRTVFNDHCGAQAIVALDTAMANGSYAVAQHDVSQYTEQKAIRVVWDTRSSTVTPLPEFSTSGSRGTQLSVNWTGYCEIYLNTDGNIFADSRIETGGGSGWEIAFFNGERYTFRPFLTTYEIPYPQDYEGEIIPDTWQPVEAKQTQYDWRVLSTGVLDVRYSKNLDIELDGRSRLRVLKCTDNFDNCTNDLFGELWEDDPSTAHWSSPFTKPPLAPIELKLPEKGLYIFEVILSGNTQNALGAVWQVKWDGKSFLSGTTDPDAAITPWSYYQNPVWEAFNKVSAPTYGIQAIVQAPLQFFQTMSTQLGNCTAIDLPAIRFIDLEYECMQPKLKESFGAVVVVFQTILTAGILYWTSIELFRFLNNTQDPKKDSIEVFDL